jgi:N-acetylneuraminate synthase
MRIGNREIGINQPPLVIVEIGINHEGSLERAKEMVDAAAAAGAEIVKHQTHVVESEMTKTAREVIPGNSSESIYDIMERCSLNYEDELALKNYIEEKGMIFISTPFSREAALRLEKMEVLAYKIGSGECNNYPLIKMVASFGKPMIVSTGMNDIPSIRKTVEIIKNQNLDLCLLHCTNLYPTPPELVRLGGMQELQREFPGVQIGLSDHTINSNACLAATALGATVLERHFTDSMYRRGPDIICSMDPKALKSLMLDSAEIALMRGGKKEAAKEEHVTIDFAFATVVTTKSINAGEEFNEDNIWVKRPGKGGIKAEHYETLIGKISLNDIGVDEHVSVEDVKNFVL